MEAKLWVPWAQLSKKRPGHLRIGPVWVNLDFLSGIAYSLRFEYELFPAAADAGLSSGGGPCVNSLIDNYGIVSKTDGSFSNSMSGIRITRVN